jgi:hypothetical protein
MLKDEVRTNSYMNAILRNKCVRACWCGLVCWCDV